MKKASLFLLVLWSDSSVCTEFHKSLQSTEVTLRAAARRKKVLMLGVKENTALKAGYELKYSGLNLLDVPVSCLQHFDPVAAKRKFPSSC